MLSRFFPSSPCLSRCDPPATLGDGRPHRRPRPGWLPALVTARQVMQVPARQLAGPGRGPGNDHLRPDRGSQRAGRHRLDHLPARPAIRKLAADDGPLQMSLFDQQDLAELSHPDYPGDASSRPNPTWPPTPHPPPAAKSSSPIAVTREPAAARSHKSQPSSSCPTPLLASPHPPSPWTLCHPPSPPPPPQTSPQEPIRSLKLMPGLRPIHDLKPGPDPSSPLEPNPSPPPSPPKPPTIPGTPPSLSLLAPAPSPTPPPPPLPTPSPPPLTLQPPPPPPQHSSPYPL